MTTTRIGFGFDCHRLEKSFNPNNKIMLCGVPISCDYQVIAHSDGDVALHALTDAILGAIGEGDIGIHFPPSDPQWKGKNSDHFLQFAANLLQEKYSGHINNLDLTIVAEIPKIAPHRDAIITSLSRILSINRHQVSIKATTAEGLGMVGQKQGIVCYATTCVELARSFLP
jgi:2-C-methyl-D-erythritol 4-phosphate cytidylyltransferase/2-C-methyl-D-erythritol 2,4-cyclodiphosphate synthase